MTNSISAQSWSQHTRVQPLTPSVRSPESHRGNQRAVEKLVRDGTTGQIVDNTKRIIQISYPVPLPPFNRGADTLCQRAARTRAARSPSRICELGLSTFCSRTLRKRSCDVWATHWNGRRWCGLLERTTQLHQSPWRLSTTKPTSSSSTSQKILPIAIWQAQTFLGEMPPTGWISAEKGHVSTGTCRHDPIGKDHTTKTVVEVSTFLRTSPTRRGRWNSTH